MIATIALLRLGGVPTDRLRKSSGRHPGPRRDGDWVTINPGPLVGGATVAALILDHDRPKSAPQAAARYNVRSRGQLDGKNRKLRSGFLLLGGTRYQRRGKREAVLHRNVWLDGE
jgi:hypothetical protein